MVQAISEAVADVGREARQAMADKLRPQVFSLGSLR
jgi:hypothetical protein